MQADPQFKIMIFFVTARLTGFHAELFQKMGFPVVEIHSRKSQSARTKASKIFRDNTQRILFSSDVSARGMDYPDVTMVRCSFQMMLWSQLIFFFSYKTSHFFLKNFFFFIF